MYTYTLFKPTAGQSSPDMHFLVIEPRPRSRLRWLCPRAKHNSSPPTTSDGDGGDSDSDGDGDVTVTAIVTVTMTMTMVVAAIGTLRYT